MSKLFLSSGGVRFPIIERELLKILPKEPKDLKLTFIPTAFHAAEDIDFAVKDEAKLRQMGFQFKVLDIAGMTEAGLRSELGDQDVIYVEGGNTFYLLLCIQASGFATVVRELVARGLIYVGVSAGTYVACPTIEMALWKRSKVKPKSSTPLAAMSLVPFLMSVHYNREKHRTGVDEGVKNASLPTRILTDDQALLVEDGKVTLVGEGEEIKIV